MLMDAEERSFEEYAGKNLVLLPEQRKPECEAHIDGILNSASQVDCSWDPVDARNCASLLLSDVMHFTQNLVNDACEDLLHMFFF